MTGRSKEQIELVETYCREQGLFHEPTDTPTYSQVVELDLGDVVPSLAGPRRPQDRVALPNTRDSFEAAMEQFGIPYANGSHDKESADSFPASDPPADTAPGSKEHFEEAAPAGAVAVAEPVAPAHVQVTLDDGPDTFRSSTAPS